jgi:hypothetical protein
MEAFVSTKLRSVTIRVPDEQWKDVVELARDRRRRPSELVRLLLEDAVEASRRTDAGAAHVAA